MSIVTVSAAGPRAFPLPSHAQLPSTRCRRLPVFCSASFAGSIAHFTLSLFHFALASSHFALSYSFAIVAFWRLVFSCSSFAFCLRYFLHVVHLHHHLQIVVFIAMCSLCQSSWLLACCSPPHCPPDLPPPLPPPSQHRA